MQFVPLTADIARRLERLFPQEPPIPIRLWAILDGVIQGRILVDDQSSQAPPPSWIVPRGMPTWAAR